MTKQILLVNGPNLNLLGSREPAIYGGANLKQIEGQLIETALIEGVDLVCIQSNHEGELIDFLHKNKSADYLIINPGGLTHTSVSLRDAVSAVALPFIEVHISNTLAREGFRHQSYFSELATGIIIGCGVEGYEMALKLVLKRLKS